MSDKPEVFHVSENGDIEVFHPLEAPNPDAGLEGKAVWAIASSHLANYLLPRDCPRVTYRPGKLTNEIDMQKYFPHKKHVIVVEEAWLSRIESTELFLYEFDSSDFELWDECAGYYISRSKVRPRKLHRLKNLREEIESREVDFQVLPNLQLLKDEIASSSLAFSIIRMRNAQPL